MQRNRQAVYILLLAFTLIVQTIVNYEFRDVQYEQRVADRQIIELDIKNGVAQLKSGSLPYIEMSKLVRISWDKLYIFGPYTSESSIDAVLGIHWPWSIRTSVDSNDFAVLLVFTRQGNVVNYLDYVRGNGDFSDLIDWNDHSDVYVPHAEYTYEQARFALDENGEIYWIDVK